MLVVLACGSSPLGTMLPDQKALIGQQHSRPIHIIQGPGLMQCQNLEALQHAQVREWAVCLAPVEPKAGEGMCTACQTVQVKSQTRVVYVQIENFQSSQAGGAVHACKGILRLDGPAMKVDMQVPKAIAGAYSVQDSLDICSYDTVQTLHMRGTIRHVQCQIEAIT